MIGRVWRRVRVYSAVAGMAPKGMVAYRAWFWMELFVQVLSLVIFVYFWSAVYGERSTLSGLARQQTLNYIMLAQILLPVMQSYLVHQFGEMLVRGEMAIELLRPLDLQLRFYSEAAAYLGFELLLKLPLALFAWLVFDLELPADPVVWGAFLISLVLGHAVVFLFSWLFACLAFYTTESWGLHVVLSSVSAFFSGAFVPLALMPDWLHGIALGLPFAQGLYVPVSILTGITPLADAPRVWLTQVAWLAGVLLASRLLFRVSVRRVTVHGG